MDKSVEWKVAINKNAIATLESTTNLPEDEVESHLTIIGILDNIKQKHLERLNFLYEKKFK